MAFLGNQNLDYLFEYLDAFISANQNGSKLMSDPTWHVTDPEGFSETFRGLVNFAYNAKKNKKLNDARKLSPGREQTIIVDRSVSDSGSLLTGETKIPSLLGGF